jgi:hypothetical protein
VLTLAARDHLRKLFDDEVFGSDLDRSAQSSEVAREERERPGREI